MFRAQQDFKVFKAFKVVKAFRELKAFKVIIMVDLQLLMIQHLPVPLLDL